LDWLPQLIPLSEYGGDFSSYVDAVYRIFRRDFIYSQPLFQGRPCYCDVRPDSDGRECGFWHIVTTGRIETERVPDLRRCERIAWPRAIIDAADTSLVRVWPSERRRAGKGTEMRLNLAPADFSYLVVLRPTKRAFLLLTAFFLEHEHQRRRKKLEYQSSQNS
jgi:hypothetical protein